jgi:two-component system response regulator AtoC
MNTKILVVEDEPEVRDYLGLALKQQGYAAEFAEDGEEAINFLTQRGSDIGLMLLDIIMPRKDGLDTLQEVRQFSPRLPIVMLSGSCSPPHIIQAMKGGADDFLQKPIGFEELGNTIERVLNLKSGNRNREPVVRSVRDEGALVSNWAHKIATFLSHIGESDVPVLLRGETGVGKEVVARQLHNQSPRKERPFLKVNCAALPSELVESELFGYERGAFTGAFKTSEGRFKQADGGTILLDEIGDMDVKLQAKLLQVLQDQEFLRLGAKEPTRVDVRVMAATHCDLEESIVQGRFREDLYYRLNVISIYIPSLRERKDEILGLAEHLLRKHGNGSTPIPAISPSLKQALLNHDWPGNIRELENVMRQLLVVGNSDMVEEELQRRRRKVSFSRSSSPSSNGDQLAMPSFPRYSTADLSGDGEAGLRNGSLDPGVPVSPEDFVNGFDQSPAGAGLTTPSPHMLDRVDQFKKNADASVILSALKTTRWNRRQAANLLKIDYKALLYKMKKLKITA